MTPSKIFRGLCRIHDVVTTTIGEFVLWCKFYCWLCFACVGICLHTSWQICDKIDIGACSAVFFLVALLFAVFAGLRESLENHANNPRE